MITAAGVLALPLLSSLDYLVLRDDETARRLIRPEVRRFVEEDAAVGSVAPRPSAPGFVAPPPTLQPEATIATTTANIANECQ